MPVSIKFPVSIDDPSFMSRKGMFHILDWLRRLIGPENIHRMIGNALQCLSYPELNRFVGSIANLLELIHDFCFRHFLCNFLDLMVEKMIPNATEEEFLKKYVYMHTGMR